MKKEVLKEDIKDLEFLIKKYSKEKKFEKASECKVELERIKGELNEKNKN